MKKHIVCIMLLSMITLPCLKGSQQPTLEQALTLLNQEIENAEQTSLETLQTFQNLSSVISGMLPQMSTLVQDRTTSLSKILTLVQQLKSNFYTLRERLLTERALHDENTNNVSTNLTQLQTIINALEADKNNLAEQIAQLENDYNVLLTQNTNESQIIINKVLELKQAYSNLAEQRVQFISDMQTIVNALQDHANAESQDNQILLNLLNTMQADVTSIENWLTQDQQNN